MTESITVLGGGFAGLAAAQRAVELGADVDLYERQQHLGGHAASMSAEGFTFDEGPHVSFTKIPKVKKLLAEAIGQNHHEFASIVQNYFRGHWVKHPAQAHLHGLPSDLVTRCIMDFLKAAGSEPASRPDRYSDWLLAAYGETFSTEFPYRYTRKYWTVGPEEMTTSWIGPRMYRPDVEEVIRGAVGPVEENKHYIKAFRYPEQGGFGAYTAALMSDATMHLGRTVSRVDPARRRVTFLDGETVDYSNLVSSLPLPELIAMMENAPSDVREAAERLICTSLAVVDVGVRRDEGFPEGHWLYFYDEDVCFARANYPHLLARSNAPPGHGSIQVEVYYSRLQPLQYDDVLNRAIDDMRKTGLLLPDDDVVFTQARHITYGNVLYDHARDESLKKIKAYLDHCGIHRCGRYGLWNYHWTDQSIVSGWQAAERILLPDRAVPQE